MARIRGQGNRDTEVALARMLRKARIKGWRRRQRVFGKPDFVFRPARVAVFVDGCFWHSCPRHATKPAANRLFWRRKLEGTRARDRRVNAMLRLRGWRVVRIWEHDIQRHEFCISRVLWALEARRALPQASAIPANARIRRIAGA